MVKNIAVVICLLLTFSGRPLWAEDMPDTSGATSGNSRTPAISVEDLGFSKNDIQSDPQYQKDLQTRSDMLQIHQTLGLITAVPMTAEYVLGLTTAGQVSNGSTNTDLHAALGITTAALYTTTALFAILAPKPKGLKPSGNTGTHVDLAWIHAPLMIVVPLLGDMVNDQIQNHQPVGNLGTIHGILATALLVSYLTSATVMTF